MPEKRKASVTKAFLRFTTIASAVAIILMGALWIGDDLFHFQKDSERIRQEFLEARQNELKQEVNTYLAKIADQRATLDDSLRTDLRRRVEEAWSVADSLFRLNMGKRSTAELAEMIREALRPIRYNNRRGYFFATSLDGIEQLFADRPELEGQNLLDMKDTDGKFVIRDMIHIAREKGEGFYEYTWSKPHTHGVNHAKLAYIKNLPHLDWFIGTGEYIEDVEADRQNEILRQLEFERFGTGGYFFAGTLDGISLAGPAKGSNVLDVTDVNGVKIVQEMIKAAQNGGGFVEYVLPPFSATNPHRKLSYVTMVPGWNWYLGAGTNMEIIEEEIAHRHTELWTNARKHSAFLLVFLAVTVFLQIALARRATRKLEVGFAAFMDFFRRAGEHQAQLVPEAQPFSELENLAVSANAMFDARLRAEKRLGDSEARYRRLVDNARDAIFILNAKGLFLDANAQACRRLGYTLDEIRQLHVWDIDIAATPKKGQTLFTALLQQTSMMVQGVHRTKAGVTFPVEIQVTLFHEHGEPLVLGISRDITERLQAEETLRQSEEKFVHIFHSSPDALLLIDMNTEHTVEVNAACSRVFGYTKDELLGRATDRVGIYKDNGDRARLIEHLRRDGNFRNLEVEMVRKDGSPLVCHVSSQRLTIDGTEHALTVYRDITEQKKIQEMMIHAEKMVSMGGIAAGIAHEINNPLGIVLQASQNLANRTRADFPKNLDAAREIGLDLELMAQYMKARKVDVFIEEIRAAGIRAAEIVRNMLNFSRREGATQAMCSLRDLATKAISLAQSDYDLKKQYNFKKLTVTIEETNSIPLVLCNETQIEQVFLNLLRNAAQAMATSEVPIDDPQITVRLSSREGWVRTEIEDNGPGIPPDVQRRIFEPFFTTKSPGEGTGLGLSVSYFIVTRGHGGQIFVSSRPGGGTRFTLDLPLRTLDDAVEPDIPATHE